MSQLHRLSLENNVDCSFWQPRAFQHDECFSHRRHLASSSGNNVELGLGCENNKCEGYEVYPENVYDAIADEEERLKRKKGLKITSCDKTIVNDPLAFMKLFDF